MQKRKTAGEMSLKAASDSTKYDGIEVAEAQMHDIVPQLLENAHAHLEKIDEPEFFVVMVRASDPLIVGIVRQKFYSYPYMPSPRPEQAVFLYNKAKDSLKFLWSLPPAKVMAAISEATVVSRKWERTKGWCDAFYDRIFWQYIRKEHNIDHLSEIEYLNANREKLIKASGEQIKPTLPDTFDFSKITTNQVVDSQAPIPDKGRFNMLR